MLKILTRPYLTILVLTSLFLNALTLGFPTGAKNAPAVANQLAPLASTKGCKKTFGGWNTTCLMTLLRSPDYFDVSNNDVSDSELRKYVDANGTEVASALLQVDYGRNLYAVIAGDATIFPDEQAYIDALRSGQNIIKWTDDLINAVQLYLIIATQDEAKYLVGISALLGQLGTVLEGIEVYKKFEGVLRVEQERELLILYFNDRFSATGEFYQSEEFSWNDVTTNYSPILASIAELRGIKKDPINNLHEWYKNAAYSYRLIGYGEYSENLRYEQGRIIAQLAKPVVNSFVINHDDASTQSPNVVLNATILGAPYQYQASEDPSFPGVEWQLLTGSSLNPSFNLSAGEGIKEVHLRVRNREGITSETVSDRILLSFTPPSPTPTPTPTPTATPTPTPTPTATPTPTPIPGSAFWSTYQHDSGRSGLSPFIGPQTNDATLLYTRAGLTAEAPIVGPTGLIYFALTGSTLEPDSRLVAVNPDGSPVIDVSVPGHAGAVTIADDGTIYVSVGVGGAGGPSEVYCLFPNGSFKWSRSFAATNVPLTLGSDGTIYVASGFWQTNQSVLMALNPDGTTKWTYDYAGAHFLQAAAVAPNGNVIVSDSGNWFVAAHDPTDGHQLWRTYLGMGEPGNMSSTAVAPDGTIYVWYTRLWALSPNGQVLWSTPFITPDIGSPPSIASDGSVRFATSDYSPGGLSRLFSVSASGQTQWSVELAQGLPFNYPQVALDAEGSAYVSFAANGCTAPCPSLPFVFSVNNTGGVRWSYSAIFVKEIIIGGPNTAYATLFTESTWKIYSFRPSAASGNLDLYQRLWDSAIYGSPSKKLWWWPHSWRFIRTPSIKMSG